MSKAVGALRGGPLSNRFLGADREGAPGVRRYAVLWLLLLAVSAVVVPVDALPVAAPNPLLAVAVATLAGVIGSVLVYLGTLRFLAFGRRLDLYAGAAFGVLALTNLGVRVIPPSTGVEPPHPDASLYLILLLRTLAAVLLLVGLVDRGVPVAPERRARRARLLGGSLVLAVPFNALGILAAGDWLWPAVAPGTRRLLDEGAVIPDALPGQEPWLLLTNGLIGLAMLLATLGYTVQARRLGDPYLGAVATALTLLTFGQLHSILAPPVVLDYVSTADAFLLAAYLFLLFTLVAHLGRDLIAGAARDERLRLSRELHDGLMQHLGLLSLRLGRAADPGRAAAQRERDLEAARRVLDAAMLEARQAITVLRTGVVSWQEFQDALGGLVDEFGLNHEVEVRFDARGMVDTLGAGLQADILRIVHEACSNAVRHGGATLIEVRLAARLDCLELCVRDDGRGFDPARAPDSTGVGLRSLEERLRRRGGALCLESEPGRGVTVRARVPLAGPGAPKP